MQTYYVYIMASGNRGTLYVGVTSDLVRRAYQHRNGLLDGFTKRYRVHRLVYFETTTNVQAALQREKALKKWNRAWKIAMIEEGNPEWRDLYDDIVQ